MRRFFKHFPKFAAAFAVLACSTLLFGLWFVTRLPPHNQGQEHRQEEAAKYANAPSIDPHWQKRLKLKDPVAEANRVNSLTEEDKMAMAPTFDPLWEKRLKRKNPEAEAKRLERVMNF